MRRLTLFCLLLAAIAAPLCSQELMTPELLWKLGRVGDGLISPDGQWVLYSVRRYDLAANQGDSDLFLMPLIGGPATTLTSGPGSENDVQWGLTPAGQVRVYCTAKREGDEAPQVWTFDPASKEARRVTNLSGGVANLRVSPKGTHILFTRDIKMDPTVQDLHPDLPRADARIIDSLMYRHWDSWHDFAYSHLHVAALDADGVATEAMDLMEGLRADCPVPPFGGSSQFAWSPDGKEVAYTTKIANDWARSTDSDVYVIDLTVQPRRTRCITHGMNGYDNDPTYSPDGKWIAFHSMERPGFEADRNRIMLFERASGTIRELTAGADFSAHAAQWLPNSSGMVFHSETRGTEQVFTIDLTTFAVKPWTSGRYDHDPRSLSSDGRFLIVSRQSMIRPAELYRVDTETLETFRLTGVNDEIYEKLRLPSVEERWVRSSDGQMVHNWVIRPPDFDPKQTYPMLTYCQGGPQSQIGQWFSYRWNFHLMAARGYVVLAVNRRGLPGFGRAWNDDISKDWGGQAMQDILASTDELLTEPWVDGKRVGAIGASFGGYTVYWLMGNHHGRFASMVAHCGVFNLESMYGSTEELFFVDWDLGGPYWKGREAQAGYDRFSPHRFVQNWDTPLLVIHGEKDFRVPVTQGMEAFTAAKLQGVVSRFLYFPHEGHWVLSPQNGVLWHRTFFDWLQRTMPPTK